MSKVGVLKLLPAFKERFFYTLDRQKIPYAIQRRGINSKLPTHGKIGYDWRKDGTITDQLLLAHFKQEPKQERDWEYASLALSWQEKPSVKWICLDFDQDWQIELRPKILSHLKSYGIETLHEVSHSEGQQLQRSHNWFMLDHVEIKLIERFMLQVWQELELKKSDWEIYPILDKRNAVIRIPGGYHFKAGRANGVIVDGVVVEDPEEVIQAFLDLPVLSNTFIESKLKEGPQPIREDKRKRPRFIYLPRNMPAPMPNLPRIPGVLGSECQAYRKLIFDAVNNALLEESGTQHHNSGLVLAKLARYHDYKQGDGKGAEWWDILATEYRSRGYEDHQWDARPGENPESNVWKCETMERYFNLCEGCPFKKRSGFDSPKQLIFGEQIKKEKVGDVTKA